MSTSEQELVSIIDGIVAALPPRVVSAIKESVLLGSISSPPKAFMSVPPDALGPSEDWGLADKQWGYMFGTYELWNTKQVQRYLGGCEYKSIRRLAIKGKVRSGRSGKTGSRCVYCSRSVAQYAASLQD